MIEDLYLQGKENGDVDKFEVDDLGDPEQMDRDSEAFHSHTFTGEYVHQYVTGRDPLRTLCDRLFVFKDKGLVTGVLPTEDGGSLSILENQGSGKWDVDVSSGKVCRVFSALRPHYHTQLGTPSVWSITGSQMIERTMLDNGIDLNKPYFSVASSFGGETIENLLKMLSSFSRGHGYPDYSCQAEGRIRLSDHNQGDFSHSDGINFSVHLGNGDLDLTRRDGSAMIFFERTNNKSWLGDIVRALLPEGTSLDVQGSYCLPESDVLNPKSRAISVYANGLCMTTKIKLSTFMNAIDKIGYSSLLFRGLMGVQVFKTNPMANASVIE